MITSRFILASFLSLGLALSATPVDAKDKLNGKAEVIDGDTLEFGFRRVDLWGVDTVERFQRCLQGRQSNACGAKAIQALYNLTSKGSVRCEVIERNRYNRELVKCRTSQGRDINREMVSQGWALANTADGDDYVRDQQRAKSARRGIWAWKFIEPKKWRAGIRLEEHEFKRSFRTEED